METVQQPQNLVVRPLALFLQVLCESSELLGFLGVFLAVECGELFDSIRDLRLALVDLDLPDSDYSDRDNPRGGFEVVRWARERFPTALVMISPLT